MPSRHRSQISVIPSAYQRGYQDFYGRDFLVTPDVLIPRPESEMLIDEILTLAGKSYLPGVVAEKAVLPENPIIYDIGTGSGCLAITLKLELPDARVVAVDISKKALEIAKNNALRLKAPITLIISHLLDFVKEKTLSYGFPEENLPSSKSSKTSTSVSFPPDLIVANLPYVDRNWDWLDLHSLSFEPAIALYAEDHGLKLIFELIRQASGLKVKWLVLEADPCQHDEIVDFARTYGYQTHNIRGFCLSLAAN